ncbi:MAG: O-antigen ligase family protein [Clostridia bacterium]|nr:O-antigen ligase family protein [Clostridia bacterium]
MGEKKLLRLELNTPNGRNNEVALSAMVLFTLLCILLIPAFQGTHYEEIEFFFMHLISAAGIYLLLLLVRDKTLVFLHTKLDYLLCSLVVLYFLSILGSVYPKLALEEALKYLNYFLVFWLMAHLLKTRDIKLVIKTLFFIGVLMAAVAFMMLDGQDFLDGERLVSTLTYSNAFSAYVAAMIVLGYYLIHLEEKLQPVYIWGTYFLTLAFIGSQSRIMWLIFFPGILFFALGFPEKKIKCLFNIILFTVLAFVVSMIIYDDYYLLFYDYQIYFKVGVFLVGAMISWGLSSCMNNLTSYHRWVKIFSIILISLILLVAMFFIFNLVFFQDDYHNIVHRLNIVLDLNNTSVQERVDCYRDTVKIMQHNNFLGRGGGAWKIQNPMLRSYYYWSVEPHSHFCQTGVEIGIIGLGLFIGVFVFVTFYLFKERKDAETWTLGIAFLFIYLHSLLDFDLSFGFMALVAWILLGLFNHKVKNAGGVCKKLKISKSAGQWFLLLYFLLLIPLTLSFCFSGTVGEKDEYDKVRSRLEKAIILYPLNAENYVSLGKAHYRAYFQTQDPQYLVKAVEMSNRALEKGYHNYFWFVSKVNYLMLQGELESVLRVLEESPSYIRRFENNEYAQIAQIYRRLAEKAEQQQEAHLAGRANEGIIVLWEQAQAEMATVSPQFLKRWKAEETLIQFDLFLIEVIRAYLELGEPEKAKELLPELSAETFNENPWLMELA